MQLKHNIWRKILKTAFVVTAHSIIPSTAIFAQSCARKQEVEAEVKKLQVEKKTVEKQCDDERKMKKEEYDSRIKVIGSDCKFSAVELKNTYEKGKEDLKKQCKEHEEKVKKEYKEWI